VNASPGRGEYAAVTPASADPGLAAPPLDVDLTSAKWLRLGVMLRVPPHRDGQLLEWFWRGNDRPGWTAEQSHQTLLETSGNWRVYWTYIPDEKVGTRLTGLRLDPVNAQVPAYIAWISMDAIGR
jgi:hypothetical protein